MANSWSLNLLYLFYSLKEKGGGSPIKIFNKMQNLPMSLSYNPLVHIKFNSYMKSFFF